MMGTGTEKELKLHPIILLINGKNYISLLFLNEAVNISSNFLLVRIELFINDN
jgi:hypothetical protein